MKRLLCFLLLISLNAHAESEKIVLLKGSTSYEVVGKVAKSEGEQVLLKLFEKSTSEVRIELSNEKKIKMTKGLVVKVCIEVAQDCNWVCKAQLKKFIKDVSPWELPRGRGAMKEVDSCPTKDQ